LERANTVLGDRLFGEKVSYLDKENTAGADYMDIEGMVLDAAITQYEEKVKSHIDHGIDFNRFERMILLDTVDKKWTEHIDAMMQLRNGVSLRSYAQKNPIVEYKRESMEMFNQMVESINEHVVLFLFKVRFVNISANANPSRGFVNPTASTFRGPVAAPAAVGQNQVISTGTAGQYTNAQKTVGRNEPCPCGSGKKYKNCCGA